MMTPESIQDLMDALMDQNDIDEEEAAGVAIEIGDTPQDGDTFTTQDGKIYRLSSQN